MSRIVLTIKEAQEVWDKIPAGDHFDIFADAIEAGIAKFDSGNQVSTSITFTIVPNEDE